MKELLKEVPKQHKIDITISTRSLFILLTGLWCLTYIKIQCFIMLTAPDASSKHCYSYNIPSKVSPNTMVLNRNSMQVEKVCI